MAQSYVGKRTLSKGIGRIIRRFAYSSFKFYAFGYRGRVSTQLDGLLPAATSFCAVAMMQDVLVLWGRGGRLPPALGGEGQRGCAKPAALAAIRYRASNAAEPLGSKTRPAVTRSS
jgi:hypothetical protein